MPIINTVNASRILGSLVIAWKEESAWNHSCLRSRTSGDVSNKTHACNPGEKIPYTEAQSQISAPSQCSFHYKWKRQWFPRMGHSYRRRYPRREWWNLRRVVCHCTISLWKNWYDVWSCYHHRGPSCFLRCQNSFQQHCWDVCYDWGTVFPWSSWPGCPWCGLVYLWWL